MQSPFSWRALSPSDLPALQSIADRVHPAFPEDRAVFAERLRLYPFGMRLLEAAGEALGYLVSHPWRAGAIPALNAQLHELPAAPDSYYLHDLALLPAARGKGAAGFIVERMVRDARSAGFPAMSLVAVNGSRPFWQRHGFDVAADGAPAGALDGYGPDARMMVRRLGA